MSQGLAGKVAVLTGGSRGIGRAVVLDLVTNGIKVVFTYRQNKAAAESLTAEAEAIGGRAIGVQHDVSDYTGARAVMGLAEEQLGPVEFLVNNAGITRDKPLLLMDEPDWRDVIETNLYGTINFCRAAVYSFMKRKDGRIVNVTSVSGLAGLPGQTNYSASKAGVIGFTKGLAKEVAKFGVRVNAVAPGFIATEMLSGMPEKVRDEFMKLVPLARCGQPEEVARAVRFLLCDDASYITGQVLAIDGGLYM